MPYHILSFRKCNQNERASLFLFAFFWQSVGAVSMYPIVVKLQIVNVCSRIWPSFNSTLSSHRYVSEMKAGDTVKGVFFFLVFFFFFFFWGGGGESRRYKLGAK